MPTCNPTRCPFAARIKQLEAIILDGAPVPDPSMERAVEASLRGDWGPLMRINEQRKEGCPSCGSRHLGHDTHRNHRTTALYEIQ